MPIQSLLIANRGEIAIRVIRAATELGIATHAVYSEDDAQSPHVAHADHAHPLHGRAAAAYLDAAQISAAARAAGCDAIHPGYGFLSEQADFARRCADAGLAFVGPNPEALALLGDKCIARDAAAEAGVPTLSGTGPAELAEVEAFLAARPDGGTIVIKAVAGGGGRGMRVVTSAEDLGEAYARCRSEARSAFGDDRVYAEALLPRARHVEVQVIGDGHGGLRHAWERDCSVQRRHQKLVEIAPSPWLTRSRRDAIVESALRIAAAAGVDNLATIEFLLDAADPERFFFIEANARLQVEHTVTEEVTGIDLVKAQLRIAGGDSLSAIGVSDVPEPRGYAIQLRVNAETMSPHGQAMPTSGTIAALQLPSGPGVRIDTAIHDGYAVNPAFDSLLAKVIAYDPSPDFHAALARAGRALGELRIDGIQTNAPFLRALLRRPEFAAGEIDTTFIERHAGEIAAESGRGAPEQPVRAQHGVAGAVIDTSDPLAVLWHGKAEPAPDATKPPAAPEGAIAVTAPMQGTVIEIAVSAGDVVRPGERLFVMEAMKMEHVVVAPIGGRVAGVTVAVGVAVLEGHPLAYVEPTEVEATARADDEAIDLDLIRSDLAEAIERHAIGRDERRPDAVARRRKTGQRTARENIEDLCDPGSFVEYGALVLAAQRRRRTVEELIERTPADGLIAGIGSVNADRFGAEAARCVAMSYDYTVLAGTQGAQNHRKKDRLFELAERWRLPIVFFTEGGGGRPGDTDGLGVAGLDVMAFHYFGRLSGLVPLVGVVSGRCFAGNAAILGCCDVVIATENANIGMGGPAMIEGGGLGVFRPEEVGPMSVQVPNGVVDVAVKDEEAAVAAAKQYLSYFQGALGEWQCADQRLLRAAIPENRRRVYDVRRVIDTLADTGSVLELRRGFGAGMVTALVRVEGRPLGLIANNPSHLAGAIDSDAADKAARMMQLCDAFGLPILSLCDTPGIMVGPEVEKTALVRHASRMFVTGASVGVPFFTVILRKAYGLGAQAMAGGSFRAPFFTVSWPTGEFGGMGLEGAVKLGFRNEIAAIEDPEERRKLYEEMVERMYERGKAVNTASHFEIDDVIDPAETRRWITRALMSLPPQPQRMEKRRPAIDTW